MSLIVNKKVHLNYEVLETISAGIELLGFEVKALKAKHGSLDGSYILTKGGQAYLINAEIPPYQVNNTPTTYDSRRERKLLLTKKEIIILSQKRDKDGLTVVPISMYNKGSKVKVDIAVAKGKKKYDKRQDLKKKDANREMRRTLKNE